MGDLRDVVGYHVGRGGDLGRTRKGGVSGGGRAEGEVRRREKEEE